MASEPPMGLMGFQQPTSSTRGELIAVRDAYARGPVFHYMYEQDHWDDVYDRMRNWDDDDEAQPEEWTLSPPNPAYSNEHDDDPDGYVDAWRRYHRHGCHNWDQWQDWEQWSQYDDDQYAWVTSTTTELVDGGHQYSNLDICMSQLYLIVGALFALLAFVNRG